MDNYDILQAYYDLGKEDGRLSSKHGQIEFLTTMHYIKKYLSPDSKILEIGAGTGRYSHKLALDGYDVTAVELINSNIETFKTKIKGNETLRVIQGNALDLNFLENNIFDVTLLLGPMYHLYTLDDQLKAMSEALRVTKNNGIIIVAYCLMDATIMVFGFIKNNIKDVIEKKLLDTETFRTHSTPAEIFQLYRKEDIDNIKSNFNVDRLHYVATDLYSNYFPQLIDEMDEETFSVYLKYHLHICERNDVIGISHHSIDVLRKINK